MKKVYYAISKKLDDELEKQAKLEARAKGKVIEKAIEKYISGKSLLIQIYPKDNDKITSTFDISPDIYIKLWDTAGQYKLSMRVIIEQAIMKYLKTEAKKNG